MARRLIYVLVLGGLVVAFYGFLQPREPAPELIQLAVRATLHAMPSPTPLVVEVTRVVVVTATPPPTATETPVPTATPVAETESTLDATPVPAALSLEAEVKSASVVSEPARVDAAIVAPEPVDVAVTESIVDGVAADEVADGPACGTWSDRTYAMIPVAGGAIDHPDGLHGDLNLSLRGYAAVEATRSLVQINGPTDGDPPQIGAVLPGTAANIASTYRINQWDWGCGEHGCRSSSPVGAEVSMIGLATSPGMSISIPSRSAEIYGGGYVAMVIYAEENRLTLVYTREDTVANGYAVHLENFCVDRALLDAYHAANSAGRHSLPAVRNGEIVGVAAGNEVGVAVRDRGAFGDPRSRKDWWK